MLCFAIFKAYTHIHPLLQFSFKNNPSRTIGQHITALSHTFYPLSAFFHAWADKFPCIPTRMSRSVGTHDTCKFISTKGLIKNKLARPGT
jgi:hypothetical protein